MDIEQLPQHFNKITKLKLNQLKEAAGTGPLLILTHDNPDPDGLASGAVLSELFRQKWNLPARVGYSGLVERAENKVMLKLLTPMWVPLDDLARFEDFSAIALVDTQPGSGNNRLPETIRPAIVIDHHRTQLASIENVPFVDVRPEIGATTSMVYQYYEAAGLVPSPDLASAVYYGIQTDTQGLMRPHSIVDLDIYIKTLTRIDRRKLNQVIHARVPKDYYRAFNHGLESAQIFGKVVFCYLGDLHRPDFVAELADTLIRLQGIEAVLCLGYHGDTMYLSLRTPSPDDDAGLIIQQLVSPHGKAGGHDSIAGGQIRLENGNPDWIAKILLRSFLELMEEQGPGEPLL